MAAGLPVVVSDWSGYRETVVEGETGHLIPTAMPGAGESLGIYLTERYCAHLDPYPAYVGSIAQMVSVDIRRAGEAIAGLALDRNKRTKMGEAARLHAAANFDWRRVMQMYDCLFSELARIREREPGLGIRDRRRETAIAAVPDPFRAFAGFATAALTDTTVVMALCNGLEQRGLVATLFGSEIASFANHAMIPLEEFGKLLERISEGPASIASLYASFPGFHRDQILASCAWLLKYGLIEIWQQDVESPASPVGAET